MIARNFVVGFCIFSLLKYDRIFGKNLGHDTYGVKWIFDTALCWGSVQGLIPEIYVSL